MLAEALAAGRQIEALYATERGLAVLRDRDLAVESPVFAIPDRAMERLSTVTSPPGLLGVVAVVSSSLESVLDGSGPVLILAGVGDPGNAGTLLRSAEIFGISRVIFTPDAVEPYNPKVIRASMGAIFRQSIAVVDGSRIRSAAAAAGVEVVAAAADGEPLQGFAFPQPLAIAIGSERHGVAGSIGACRRRVAVEQFGAGESLNAAIAGAIIFYEFSQYARRR